MPLVISGNGPTTGTLEPGVSLADRIAAIPGLIGAFDPAPLTVGAVSTWPAAIGTGALTQGTAARQPSRATVGAIPAITQLQDDNLRSSGTWGSGLAVTVGLRAYLADPAVDQQTLFGGGDAFKLMWRSAGNFRFVAKTTAVVLVPPVIAAGWYTIILSQSLTTTALQVGDTVQTQANAGGDMVGGMAIGDSIIASGPNATGFGWRGSYGRVLIAQSATQGTVHHAAVREWLEA